MAQEIAWEMAQEMAQEKAWEMGWEMPREIGSENGLEIQHLEWGDAGKYFKGGITLSSFLKPILYQFSHITHQIKAQNLLYKIKLVG